MPGTPVVGRADERPVKIAVHLVDGRQDPRVHVGTHVGQVNEHEQSSSASVDSKASRPRRNEAPMPSSQSGASTTAAPARSARTVTSGQPNR